MILLLLLSVLILVCGAAFAFFFFQLKDRSGEGSKQLEDPPDQRLAECVKCGKRRIIINDGICGSCWSSLGTKELN